jgi:hypothetical protein
MTALAFLVGAAVGIVATLAGEALIVAIISIVKAHKAGKARRAEADRRLAIARQGNAQKPTEVYLGARSGQVVARALCNLRKREGKAVLS